MTRSRPLLCLALLFAAPLTFAQSLPPGFGHGSGAPPDSQGRGLEHGPDHPTGRGMEVGPPGRWWNDPRIATELALTPDQRKRMDIVFTQSRMRLIDLTAALQKEELSLEPMLSADKPDSSRVLVQIDRVAQARAELERTNGRMLFGLREILTTEQWKRLQAHAPPGERGPTPGGPGQPHS